MEEKVQRVATALKESFKRAVSEGVGKPFEATGVILPNDGVWERYARAAVEELQE